MMIIRDPHRLNPTVKIPLWDVEDPTAHNDNAFAALQRYLPSNRNDLQTDGQDHEDVPVDAFSCDNFRMYEFKVKKCARARSHDWTECPFAHAGEKARRRDPRKYHYNGSACADFRRGACGKGDACEYAHGVFECWLHPSRYRTQPCKDGTHCSRRVCFFAHTLEQIRVDGSSGRAGQDPFLAFGSSPKSTLYSPPSSPTESMGSVQVNKVKMGLGLGLGLSVSPPSWSLGFGSPRSPLMVRHGFVGLSSTPGRVISGSGLGVFDKWELSCEEEPMMERVESGRELRERIYEKLSRENSLDRVGRA